MNKTAAIPTWRFIFVLMHNAMQECGCVIKRSLLSGSFLVKFSLFSPAKMEELTTGSVVEVVGKELTTWWKLRIRMQFLITQWLVTKNPKLGPWVRSHGGAALCFFFFFFHLIHPSGLLSLSEKREILWLWLRNVHGHSAWATSRLAWRKAVVPPAQTRRR